jgi:hypothetical protein
MMESLTYQYERRYNETELRNILYCSAWDKFMDVSEGPTAPNFKDITMETVIPIKINYTSTRIFGVTPLFPLLAKSVYSLFFYFVDTTNTLQYTLKWCYIFREIL